MTKEEKVEKLRIALELANDNDLLITFDDNDYVELNEFLDAILTGVDETALDIWSDIYADKFDMEPIQLNETQSGYEYGYTYNQLKQCYKAGYRKAMEDRYI